MRCITKKGNVMLKRSKAKIVVSVVGVIGFLLSPLSWWNDLLVNIPLAYLGGTIVGFVYKPLFYPALVISYWLTNIVGLIMIHYSAKKLINSTSKSLSQKEIWQNIGWSVVYTIVMATLVKLEILRFPTEYFK